MERIILLVEDDDMKARSLMSWIKFKSGITVIRAKTMITGLRALRLGTMEALGIVAEIGAVVTDWNLPFREDDGRGPRDHAGEQIYITARESGLPVCVYSGREEPVPGFTPWILSGDPAALTAWLQEVKTTAFSAAPTST